MWAATVATFSGGVFTETFGIGSTDVDMVRIDLVAGQVYRIGTDNGTAGDVHLRVFDQFGVEVKANDDGFRAADDVAFAVSPFVEFTPNHSGTFYVSVGPHYMRDDDPATTAGRITPENPLAVTAGTPTIADLATNFRPSAGAIAAESRSDRQSGILSGARATTRCRVATLPIRCWAGRATIRCGGVANDAMDGGANDDS